jgi:hypothetical protein
MVANLTVKRYQGFETGSTPAHSEICLPPGGLPPGIAQYRGLASNLG